MRKRQRKKYRKDRRKEKQKIIEEDIHKITKEEETDEWNDRSDVWLTVHRNSVWMRKTN